MNDEKGDDGIPPGLAKWLKSRVGQYQVVSNYRRHSERTGVWRVRTGVGMRFLKIHKEKRKWHPEVYAYENWASAYEPHVPQLIAAYEDLDTQGILLSEIEGIPLRDVDLPEEQVLSVYETAGRLARNLHSLEVGSFFGLPHCDGSPQGEEYTDAVAYMTHDLERWANLAKADKFNCLRADEMELARWAHENVDVYSGEPAIPINNDYTPGNWLVSGKGEFAGVIDLECMQWGVRVDSFAMLWHRYFPGSPEAEKAFFRGYGMNLKKEKPDQVRNVLTKIGVAEIIWGSEHAAPGLVERGRATLRGLMSCGEML